MGDYYDEFLCDIIFMEVRYILLDRLWKFDKKEIYNGLINEINFIHGSKKFKFVFLIFL